jgi:hypothetical protein
MDFLKELWHFVSVRKKYWLLPLLIVMAVFGGLVLLTQGSAVAPFIYPLF